MNSIFASDPAVSYLDSVMIEFKDEIDDPLALILKKEPAARQAYVAVDEDASRSYRPASIKGWTFGLRHA
jgi:hypothetical protein